MKKTEIIMGMPITIEIVGTKNSEKLIGRTFEYFKSVDERFSTYKEESEISRINRGLPKHEWSDEMKQVFGLCEQTKLATDGYFDIRKPDGSLDPSGLVKGWAIRNAADSLLTSKVGNFYVEAGGDIQVHGKNTKGEMWKIGIRNPFDVKQIVKTVVLTNGGIATSGTYIRGQHIYDPKHRGKKNDAIASITVIGPNIYDADRFATAAFAMGENGTNFIESLPRFEAYTINSDKIAIMTSGFEKYVL